MSLTVFVTTIEGYRQRLQTVCNINLATLLESQVDPAEDGDLLTTEYSLHYEPEQRESSLMLEVVDDNIAENDETFIVYTSVIESVGDDCARAVHLQDNDKVHFNFSTSLLETTEGSDLQNRLSIIKHGQNEPNVSFRVSVTPGNGNLNQQDYEPNADHNYVFTKEISQLPVATMLRDDRSGESVESFSICLPSRTQYIPMIAHHVEPSCVTVTIIDDDSVLIGFVNSSITLMEGGPTQRICVDIKPEGLPLDPFDYIPLTISSHSLENKIQFGEERFEFDGTSMITCKSITALDDDVSDGTRSSLLVIDTASGTTVPVEFFPRTIPISITDNDVVSFELTINGDQSKSSPQTCLSLVEGDSKNAQNIIKIVKTGLTTFACNVTLNVEALTGSLDPSKIRLTSPVTLDISDSEANVSIEVTDDQVSEKKKQYHISIVSIEPFKNGTTSSSLGALTSTTGEPIELLVYDNDFNLTFGRSSVRLAEGSDERVCVMVQGLNTSSIYPTLMIPLSISILNTSSTEGLMISTKQLTITSMSYTTCFDVTFPLDNDECDRNPRNFTIQLLWTPDTEYTVNFQQQNITVIIDDAQDCASAVCAACVAVPIVILVVGIAVAIPIILTLLRYYIKKKSYYPAGLEEEREHER